MNTMANQKSHIENIEVDLLLEAIFRRYGHDFRHYARASVERRVKHFLSKAGCGNISELIPKLLYDDAFFARFLRQFSVPVTEMFRDPSVYRNLREKVMPLLKTYPFIKVWHAGCASGEEAYSVAIVLKEAGLYNQSTIYATDFNDEVLQKAMDGIYDLQNMKLFTKNYQDSGGTRSFSEYYHARYGAIAMDQMLRRNITFANHNLVTDSVFSETHLVLCRNVLIYFDKDLQDRALELFRDSLVRGGFLCLGSKETIQFSSVKDDFRIFDEKSKIYQKRP